MSHVSVVDCEIRDLTALRAAAETLGAELLYGKRTFNMYGAPQPCVHAIALKGQPDAYEIGLRQKVAGDDSVFQFACDFYDGRLRAAFGENLEGLQNEYLAVVAEQELARGGYRVEREVVGQEIYVRAEL